MDGNQLEKITQQQKIWKENIAQAAKQKKYKKVEKKEVKIGEIAILGLLLGFILASFGILALNKYKINPAPLWKKIFSISEIL